MTIKKTKVMFNNFIWKHEPKIHDEVIKCVQDYIYSGQKIGVCSDHEK